MFRQLVLFITLLLHILTLSRSYTDVDLGSALRWIVPHKPDRVYKRGVRNMGLDNHNPLC